MEDVPPQPTGHEPLVQRWNKVKGYAEWVEVQPAQCHRGHPYGIGTPAAQVSISWVGCRCDGARNGGHSIYNCRTKTDGQECRDRLWIPECSDPSRQNETDRRG